MSTRLARLAGKSAAVLVVAAGLTVGVGVAGASAGELVVTDNGYQCGVAWKNDDGSYTDWYRAQQ